ncbi:hypothetical protein BV22DRAFT_1132141 [Leucogyrophana mollusca]|uniref:Uncharacterized protein n=1 Tax=Leucogyrophana mollusca TaxID=85980 RepID=A0ACB8B9J3_9AGAM|nr:hypothetical protein BV22DRAFT_1132141 [Leucogyrophana mollusca]
MLQFGTLRACIKVDGVILTPYGIETIVEESKVTCWIPSEVGKNFSVVWQDTCDFRVYYESGTVTIDGSPSGGQILGPLRSGEPLSYANCTCELRHLRTSGSSGRPFTFSNLQLTDDDVYLKSAPARLGEIELTVWPVAPISLAPWAPIQSGNNQIVHERAKKAYSHCVGFGNEVALPYVRTLTTRPISAKPFATFVFRYRPLDRLIADGIAPPLRRADKRTVPDDFEDSDGEPGDEAMRELQALKEHVKRLERKLVQSRRSSSKRVKAEACDETIDLTI